MSPPLPDSRDDVTWRPMCDDDAEALVALMSAAQPVDEIPWSPTLAETRRELADPEMDLATDSIAAVLPDGRLAAFGYARMRRGVTRRRWVEQQGMVLPEMRRRRLGTAVLGWTEARGRELLSATSDDLPRFIEAWADERWVDRRALFEAHGYRPIRYYDDMRRPLADSLPEPRLPPGLTFVDWSAETDEEFREAHNEAFVDHWGSEPMSQELWRHRYSGSPLFRPDLTVGVVDETRSVDDRRLVGYCMGYHSEDDTRVTGRVEGWLGQVGVRRAWRGKGVATAIMSEVMRRMRAAGMDYAALDVDSENPSGAVGLYERLGFRRENRWIRWAKPA